MIRNAAWVFHDQRHGPAAARVGLFASVKEEGSVPIFLRVKGTIVAIMLIGIGASSQIPVLIGEQKVTQYPHIP